MPALYSANVPKFLQDHENLIIGFQSALTEQGISALSAEQLEAWRQQIPILRQALGTQSARTWHLLLEFEIPRRGKRVDAILLAHDLILVLEFKCGAKTYDKAARIQVEDYCLDLRDFHHESRNRILIPFLIATDGAAKPSPCEPATDQVGPVWQSNALCLGEKLTEAVGRYRSLLAPPTEPTLWEQAEYTPTPTIIEAARVLYEGKNVKEISRCHSGTDNLTKTSDAIIKAISRSRQDSQKIICFITGIPGAGKTLAGLNVVHNRELHDGDLGVFLSGNGPLVRVLSEALARDHAARTKTRLAESRRQVSTFVQNVHHFIKAYYKGATPPTDRVVIFDEAQRAWNAQQSLRKFKRNVSEPEVMLQIMDRHQDWAVIVALIGSGQEINTGEAGLREWGRTLEQKFRHWKVLISPRLIAGGISGEEDALCANVPSHLQIIQEGALHLDVSLRSYKAEAVSKFVGLMLAKRVEDARRELKFCTDFPIVLTRHLSTAREWLRRHRRGSRRIGLVASSGGRRLQAHGLDVRLKLDAEKWFLNDTDDVRSSFYLESPATEFGVQGLEIDWTGVCWDLDLVPEDGGWRFQAFKGTKWQKVNDSVRRRYVLNKYRVLLTRAREGMVIWVPEGDASDHTRPNGPYDAIAAYLESCGLSSI